MYPRQYDKSPRYIYDNFYNYASDLGSLFKIMEHSKTLINVQIGNQNPNNHRNNRSITSFIELSPAQYCQQSKNIVRFNLFKPTIDASLRTFYEPAVVKRFLINFYLCNKPPINRVSYHRRPR